MINRYKYRVVGYKVGSAYNKPYKKKVIDAFTTARNSEEAKRNIRWRYGIKRGRQHVIADDYYEYVLQANRENSNQLTAC